MLSTSFPLWKSNYFGILEFFKFVILEEFTLEKIKSQSETSELET